MTKKIWYMFAAFVVIYALLTLFIPTPTDVLERYKISSGQANFLKLTIAVPVVAIWYAAFYGFTRFYRYASTIHGAPDGQAFGNIATGLGILAVSLPVTSILSSIFEYISRDSDRAVSATTIISNYIAILFALAAFWYVYKGSRQLNNLIPIKKRRDEYNRNSLIVTGLLAVVYTYLTFQNPYRHFPGGNVEKAAFYLPDGLILFTIVIPYLFIWFIGLQAASNISEYKRTVKGVLYKQILSYLAIGLIGIILVSISLQFLINFSSFFTSISLTPLLAILYLLVLAIAVGYIFVAIGAKRLQKIEEV